MGKYKNQKYIKKVANQIKEQSEEKKKEIIKELKEYYEEALYDYNKINPYTAPEEKERRTQAVYYYEDLFRELEEKGEK